MIPLNIPSCTGNEKKYVNEVLDRPALFNEAHFLKACTEWFEDYFSGSGIFLTKSCTHALELSMLLLDLQPGDEVIMPSYTFVSAANAVVLRGATPVFVDVLPGNMNIDPACIEPAITEKTRAIIVMHYAGIAADMNSITEIAKRNGLKVVEDAAHGIIASHKGKPLGGIGDMAAFSFEQMKNLTCGQGGLLVLNDRNYLDKAEIYFSNGTDKLKFLAGERPFYQWQDKGSNFKISELQAAYLYAQLEMSETITQKRLNIWEIYYEGLQQLEKAGTMILPQLSEHSSHNAHIFYIKTQDAQTRANLSDFLRKKGIMATFHYQPLHTSAYGRKIGRFHGTDRHTTSESARLLRLPLFFTLKETQAAYIVESVNEFYS